MKVSCRYRCCCCCCCCYFVCVCVCVHLPLRCAVHGTWVQTTSWECGVCLARRVFPGCVGGFRDCRVQGLLRLLFLSCRCREVHSHCSGRYCLRKSGARCSWLEQTPFRAAAMSACCSWLLRMYMCVRHVYTCGARVGSGGGLLIQVVQLASSSGTAAANVTLSSIQLHSNTGTEHRCCGLLAPSYLFCCDSCGLSSLYASLRPW
jgi:hypothetical protein